MGLPADVVDERLVRTAVDDREHVVIGIRLAEDEGGDCHRNRRRHLEISCPCSSACGQRTVTMRSATKKMVGGTPSGFLDLGNDLAHGVSRSMCTSLPCGWCRNWIAWSCMRGRHSTSSRRMYLTGGEWSGDVRCSCAAGVERSPSAGV